MNFAVSASSWNIGSNPTAAPSETMSPTVPHVFEVVSGDCTVINDECVVNPHYPASADYTDECLIDVMSDGVLRAAHWQLGSWYSYYSYYSYCRSEYGRVTKKKVSRV